MKCASGAILAAILAVCAVAATPARAEDWPTYHHDNRGSGITGEALRWPLTEAWVYSAPAPPQPAWPGPAKWDAYANVLRLKAMRDFDPVFHVTAVGDAVFFGSSVDDAVHCLDTRTGREKWSFCTDGPVRLPPTWHNGKVYFGSDDGGAYCLDAATARLVWKHKPAADERLVPSNGKMISLWPCRTDVLVQDGKAWFAASLLPWNPSYLCCVDAETGSPLYKVAHDKCTLQGPLLASATKLYVSQGRMPPLVFDLATGRVSARLRTQGGVYAVLSEDDLLFQGRGQLKKGDGELRTFDARTGDYITTFPSASCVVVTRKAAYLHDLKELRAFDASAYLGQAPHRELTSLTARRTDIQKAANKLGKDSAEGKKLQVELKEIEPRIADLERGMKDKWRECLVWRVDSPFCDSLILAGDVLVAGGNNQVAAFSAADGKKVWQAAIVGKAYGLAAANGHLLVSTDRGRIHCFRSGDLR